MPRTNCDPGGVHPGAGRVAVLHPDPSLAQEVLTEVVTESERLSALIDDLLVLSGRTRGAAGGRAGGLALAAQVAIGGWRRTAAGAAAGATVSCAVWAARRADLVLDTCCATPCVTRGADHGVRAADTGGGARLLVDDDGHGVPEEHRARVFDRSIECTTTGVAPPAGSARLALVAEVVRRRGGAVAVTESPDGGARFDIRWPGHSIGAGRRRAGFVGELSAGNAWHDADRAPAAPWPPRCRAWLLREAVSSLGVRCRRAMAVGGRDLWYCVGSGGRPAAGGGGGRAWGVLTGAGAGECDRGAW